MGASAETIWRVPAYLPYVQPVLTEQAVREAEKMIGHRLPKEYLELLGKQNGGNIRFSLPEMVHHRIAGIGPNRLSLFDYDWAEWQGQVSFQLDRLVPFDGDGHWYLCLDYRNNRDEPAIIHADIECDREDVIAESFADYLAMLRIETDGIYVLPSMTDIESVKTLLASLLGAEFEPINILAHGYPLHRALLGRKDGTESLWLSPNKVARAFIRSADVTCEEQKHLLAGTALRYPEVAADSYLLNTTDGSRQNVLDACRRAGFVVRPLSEFVSQE